MKEIISGWVMLLDMYYYRKRLMKRYHRIKYYQRHGVLKVDRCWGFTPISNSIKKSFGQIPYSKNPPPPKRKIDKSKDVLADFVNIVGRRRFKDWKYVGNYDTTKRIADSNMENLRDSILDTRIKAKATKLDNWKSDGYRLGVFNQDEVRMLLDNREISEKANIPEIGVDKDLLSELESKISYRKII